jgi:hypothetical protein
MKMSMAWLESDVSVEAIERRPRVRKPKGCKYIQEVGHVPADEFFHIWRRADGRAYYIHPCYARPSWKRGEYVELTPLEAMAFVCDLGTTHLRRDVLRHLQGAS